MRWCSACGVHLGTGLSGLCPGCREDLPSGFNRFWKGTALESVDSMLAAAAEKPGDDHR